MLSMELYFRRWWLQRRGRLGSYCFVRGRCYLFELLGCFVDAEVIRETASSRGDATSQERKPRASPFSPQSPITPITLTQPVIHYAFLSASLGTINFDNTRYASADEKERNHFYKWHKSRKRRTFSEHLEFRYSCLLPTRSKPLNRSLKIYSIGY